MQTQGNIYKKDLTENLLFILESWILFIGDNFSKS